MGFKPYPIIEHCMIRTTHSFAIREITHSTFRNLRPRKTIFLVIMFAGHRTIDRKLMEIRTT
ncbi:hypothetical protein D3C81_1627430 [compost metagenome]